MPPAPPAVRGEMDAVQRDWENLRKDTDIILASEQTVLSLHQVAATLARAPRPEQAARSGDQAGGRIWLFLETDDFDRAPAALFTPEQVIAGRRGVLQDRIAPPAEGERCLRCDLDWLQRIGQPLP